MATISGLIASFMRSDELATCRFAIDIEGLLVAVFTECNGLSAEVEIESYEEGGLNDYEHKLPGRTKYSNVTLKSGVASSIDLWDWFHSAATGNVNRKDLSIVLYRQDQREFMRWNLAQAWPTQWQGPDLTAGSTDIAIHSLELAHNGISLGPR